MERLLAQKGIFTYADDFMIMFKNIFINREYFIYS